MITVREGERLPFFYGKISPDFATLYGWQCALIPINYLYKFWYWILRAMKTRKWEIKIEDMKSASCIAGRIQGFNDGWAKGKEYGYNCARNQFNTWFNNRRERIKNK